MQHTVKSGMTSKQLLDPIAVLRGHRADVQAVTFHPNLQLLYSGDAQGDLVIWDLDLQRPAQSHRLHPPSAGILGLSVLRQDPLQLVSQGRDGTFKVWELTSSGYIASQPVQEFCTNSYSFCRAAVLQPPLEANQVCSLAEDRQARLPGEASASPQSAFNTAQQQPQPPTEQVAEWTTRDPHRLIACAGHDASQVELWDTQVARPVLLLKQEGGAQSRGMCMSMQLWSRPGAQPGAPPHLWVGVGFEDGSVGVWDTAHPQAPFALGRLHSEPVLSLAVDPAGEGGVSGAAETNMVRFNIDYSHQRIQIDKKLEVPQQGIADIKIRQDGRIFIAGGWDGKTRVFSYKKAKPLAILKYHKAAATAMEFSWRTQQLAVASRDGTISIWSLYPSAG